MELSRLMGYPVSLGPDGNVVPQRNDFGATPVDGLWIGGDAGGLGGAQVAAMQG